jgi:hypothetical protein
MKTDGTMEWENHFLATFSGSAAYDFVVVKIVRQLAKSKNLENI